MASEIKLYNEDCLPAMRKMKDKQFDLAIVDPPFGIGDFTRGTAHGRKIVRTNYSKPTWNKTIPGPGYFSELKRVADRRIIWGANYFNCFEPGGALVWYKNMGALSFSQCAIASLSFQKKIDYVHINQLSGALCNDDKRIHPCQSPAKLYKWLLKNYAKPGDKILDTHLGSGSIAIACYDMGFDLTGYETDKDYYDAAVKRLENFKKQLTLF